MSNRHAPGSSTRNSVYGWYKYRAEGKGLDFLLTSDQFHVIVQNPCHYCGAAPSNVKRLTKNVDAEWRKLTEYTYSGLDRRDNALGYTPENCVSCCKQCNVAKNTYSLDEFYSWIERVRAHRPAS